jgi:hypothetical protein
MNREAVREEQRLARSQIRRDLFAINSRHCTVWKCKENDVSALRSSGRVQNFETAAPGADARFATRIEPDNYANSALPEIQGVCSTLCAEPDYCACFSLQPTEIGVFVAVNTRSQIYSPMRSELIAWLTQDGIRCREHRFIVVIRQPGEETANAAKRLTQKQIGSELVRGR